VERGSAWTHQVRLSRELLLPAQAELRVRVGQRVKGGESVLATMASGVSTVNQSMSAKRFQTSPTEAAHDASRRRTGKSQCTAQLRRGMFLLPSLFTVGNIAAGYFSITETIKSLIDVGNAHTHLDWAAIAIIFAIPFDALDAASPA